MPVLAGRTVRAIVEALVAATNLAALVSQETLCKELRTSADRTLAKLYAATDRLCLLQRSSCSPDVVTPSPESPIVPREAERPARCSMTARPIGKPGPSSGTR